MTQQALEERRAYMREWQRKNKDKCANYKAKYWEKKAAEAEATRRQLSDEQAEASKK